MAKLTDKSYMPFGAHEGKIMEDVPVSYLHFMWFKRNYNKYSEGVNLLADYIRDNLKVLKEEDKNLIWD